MLSKEPLFVVSLRTLSIIADSPLRENTICTLQPHAQSPNAVQLEPGLCMYSVEIIIFAPGVQSLPSNSEPSLPNSSHRKSFEIR